MKKLGYFTILIFFVSMVALFCTCSQNVCDNTLGYDAMRSRYPKYVDTVEDGRLFMRLLTKETYQIEEELLFDDLLMLEQYVFYNIFCNEPWHLVRYDQDGGVIKDAGKLFYVVGELQGYYSIGDTADIFIHIATPPVVTTSFSVYELVDTTIDFEKEPIIKKDVRDDALNIFRHHVARSKTRFVVVATLRHNCTDWQKSDTVYMTLEAN